MENTEESNFINTNINEQETLETMTDEEEQNLLT